MYSIRKGFTLIEMILVLALMGLLVAATSYYNSDDPRTNQLNAERLASNISDTLRNARMNTVIGKGVMSGSTLVVARERNISVSLSGITTTYTTTNGNTGTETNIQYPFYDNDKYFLITDISVSSGGLDSSGTYLWDATVPTVDISIVPPQGDIRITNSGNASQTIKVMRITVSYKGSKRYVIINTSNGVSEVVSN